ncbi:MAG TPA: response regulator transcription factor [Bacteroidetes bacterium]|nr:response regulator transcription factor [Bacteroidota bacterium]
MDNPTIRIIAVDDHQIFIEGLKVVLGRAEGMNCEVVGESGTGNGLFKLLENVEADIILLDMNLPDIDGLEVLGMMKERGIKTKVITLSMYEEPKIVKASFRAGAYGYVLKSNNVRELYKAIETVMKEETYMSVGLTLTNAAGSHTRFMHKGKLTVSYDDRFVKKYNLTKREIEVLKLVGQALSNKEIAEELFISDQTVSVHRKNIMRKIGVSSTASLIKFYYENNLV